jgi:hypothetical protein
MTPENTPQKLKVGDKIYAISFGKIDCVLTIERVTATQATAKDGLYKFDINVSEIGYVRIKGTSPTWSNVAYKIENEDLKELKFVQDAVILIQNAKVRNLPASALQQIVQIIKDNTPQQ